MSVANKGKIVTTVGKYRIELGKVSYEPPTASINDHYRRNLIGCKVSFKF